MLLFAWSVFVTGSNSTAFGQCSEPAHGGPNTASIELISPPYEGFATQLQLTEFYATGAGIGDAQPLVNGNSIAITQTNSVSLSPTLTCRTQILVIGSLPAGNYNVTWTTTENLIIGPPPRTRIRTLAFAILPAAAVPAADGFVSVMIVLVLLFFGLWRLRS